ncbi:MAG: HAMP domain-containing histidine kinase [Clostridia bacterium]|nr:HAMP domain-containing histidine kinase [Clostridia bacterium]
MNKLDRKTSASLTIVFSLAIFFVLLAAIALAALTSYLLVVTGVMGQDEELNAGTVILVMVVISVALGAVIVFFGTRAPIKPVNKLITHINRLAAGDFGARLHFKGAFSNYPAIRQVEDSFNKLAEELENTEMLRGDFINNFSHEFKTPIVSITGFAKLLNKGNLTEEEKKQYLTAIEEESVRLSYMATNVLHLTKIENQSILSEVSTFNLSEQIRTAVLLLEGKWTKKDIMPQLMFDEFMIEANEELLKQIWINLIDNAIKFSDVGGDVKIEIFETESLMTVTVSNTGSEISPEKVEKIFNKFYQGEESHTKEGNGIGLAIVKRIVDLHSGEIFVNSKNNVTTFEVMLPKAQK